MNAISSATFAVRESRGTPIDGAVPAHRSPKLALTPRKGLLLAAGVSLAIHLSALRLSIDMYDPPEAMPPLEATITGVPAPPPTPVHAEIARPKAKPVRRARPSPPPQSPELAAPSHASAIVARAGDGPFPSSLAPWEPASPVVEAPATPAPLVEPPIVAAASTAPARELPPRIDLVYRGFLGTRGFFVGDATYRLEHANNSYRISTVGEARGLAALFFRGQGRAESRGSITAAGLQPDLYSVARSSSAEPEVASFDWEAGIVNLKGDKAEPLEIPTFDPMTVLWQFYFTPPAGDDADFNIATTRKLYHYRFHRAARETVTLSFGDVEADVWQRDASDGGAAVRVWLAPSLHNVAVKVRVSNDRGTVEALLDSVRVDEAMASR